MLDTLKLMLSDYEVKSSSTLRVQPGSYEVATGEKLEFPLFSNSSGTFYGSKAYLNTDKWNLTLKPLPGGNRATGAFLQFSVPKNHYGNNFYSVGEQGTEAVINQVEQELSENGIGTNLLKADFSRVDTFKNVEPEEPFSSYYNLFSILKANRAVKRDYGTTFLLSNTQQEFCIYDKLEEMRHRAESTSDFPETMRFEHRLLNREKVKTIYGFSKVNELFRGGYAVMKEKQVEAWKESMFSYSPEEVIALGSKQLEEEMRVFKEKFPRNWFQYFLQAYGAYYLTKHAGVEVVRIALQGLESDRMKVWRAEKVLEEARRELLFASRDKNSNKTLGELYQELKSKVCLN